MSSRLHLSVLATLVSIAFSTAVSAQQTSGEYGSSYYTTAAMASPVPNPTPFPIPNPTPVPVPNPTPFPIPNPTPVPIPNPTPFPIPTVNVENPPVLNPTILNPLVVNPQDPLIIFPPGVNPPDDVAIVDPLPHNVDPSHIDGEDNCVDLYKSIEAADILILLLLGENQPLVLSLPQLYFKVSAAQTAYDAAKAALEANPNSSELIEAFYAAEEALCVATAEETNVMNKIAQNQKAIQEYSDKIKERTKQFHKDCWFVPVTA